MPIVDGVQGPAYPLKESTLVEIAAHYENLVDQAKINIFSGIVPDQIKYLDSSKNEVVIFYPEHEGLINIKTRDEKKSRNVVYPNTLIQASFNERTRSNNIASPELSVCAFDHEGNVISMPYMNTNDTVCTGTAKFPITTGFESIIEGVYEGFFHSFFTEVHVRNEIKGYEDLRDFWLNHSFKMHFPYELFVTKNSVPWAENIIQTII